MQRAGLTQLPPKCQPLADYVGAHAHMFNEKGCGTAIDALGGLVGFGDTRLVAIVDRLVALKQIAKA